MTEQEKKQNLFYDFILDPQYRIWRHVSLILGILLLTLSYTWPPNKEYLSQTSLFLFYTLANLIVYLGAIYLTVFWLTPHYLLKKRYLSYLGWFSLLVIMILVMQYLLGVLFNRYLDLHISDSYTFRDNLFVLDFIAVFITHIIALTGISVTTLFKHWLTQEQLTAQLQKESLQAELQHLKEQVNPDFLFKTLNRIGRLEEIDSPRASEMLMKLSLLLRYQLYDCNREEVFLSSEIQFITNYLNLEQLYHYNMKFHISIDGDAGFTLVPPLLFIPFIQHIVNKIEYQPSETHIHLHFETNEEQLIFTCSTNQSDVNVNHPDFGQIKQRLTLLFGNDYLLKSITNNNIRHGMNAGNIKSLTYGIQLEAVI